MKFVRKLFDFLFPIVVIIFGSYIIVPSTAFAANDPIIPVISTANTTISATRSISDLPIAKPFVTNTARPNSAPTPPSKVNGKTVTTMAITAQYSQPSLTVTNTTATSITMNVVFPGSGIYGNGLYFYDYSNGQWTDISKTWYTTNGSYVINNLKPATTYFIEEIWYTDASNAWLQRYNGFNTNTAVSVAELTIYAASDGTTSSVSLSGHAFITVKNVSSANINVGSFSGIAPGREMSLGTWGNKSEHTGLWYDLEEYFAYKNAAFGNALSLTTQLSSSQLNTVNAYIINHDAWSITNNCSSFASGLWNSVASTILNAGVPNTPTNLKNSIATQSYTTGKAIPWDYIVYFAQGTNAPKQSTVYK